MSAYTRESIEQSVRRLDPWFQNIDLNGVQTDPSSPDHPAGRWALLEPYVPDDLSGKSVLDLGCNAGYFSIKMRERGAQVVGVDWAPRGIEQSRLAADVLGLDIDYRLDNIYQFVLNCDQVFDYVVFLGVFYHLRYPLLVLDRLAEITQKSLYFQTVITDVEGADELEIPEDIDDKYIFCETGFPKMYFIENRYQGGFNNWFICNVQAALAALRSSGFDNIIRSGTDCFICESAMRSSVQGRRSHDLHSLRSVRGDRR